MKLTVADYRKLEERLNALESTNKSLQEENEGFKAKEADAQKEKEAADAEKAKADREKADREKAEEESNRQKLLEGQRAPMQKPISHVNTDESRCKSFFGVSNVKDLISVNTEDKKFRRVPAELKALACEIKKEFQNARMIAQMFYGDPMDKIGAHESQDRFPSCPNILESYYGKNILAPRLKAFGTGISGGGAEWIPTAIASTYIPEVELDRELVGALRQIDMPTSPYELPTASDFTKARRIAENTSMTDTSFTTGKVILTASKYGEYFIIPEEVNEDSIVGILDLARMELTNAHLRAYESCVINGTKIGTTHIDSDTQAGAADLAEKQFHGLRYYGIQNSANGGTYDYLNGAISDAKLRAHRKELGKFGVNPLDLLWIVGPSAYNGVMGTDNVVTIDKLGDKATVLKGQLGTYAGTPIMQSGFMREDLNASGVYDGVTTDRTGLLLVHKDRWYWGVRRPIRMALREALSKDDRYEIASYSRVDFQGHPQGADEITVSYGINVPS
jgi:HK97 family phage major capsid protein